MCKYKGSNNVYSLYVQVPGQQNCTLGSTQWLQVSISFLSHCAYRLHSEKKRLHMQYHYFSTRPVPNKPSFFFIFFFCGHNAQCFLSLPESKLARRLFLLCFVLIQLTCSTRQKRMTARNTFARRPEVRMSGTFVTDRFGA